MDASQETFSELPPAAPADGGNGRRPTMKQVAALAGVSLATVSRVVNGGPKVRPDLAARVHEAVELLGYRHNLTASTLRRADRLSASIGLIFEDVANPFFSAVHRGVEEVARERGVLTFAGSSDERPERERELAESFSARRVDGLIIAPAATDHSYLQRDRAAGVALVFVDRPASFVDADVVLTDNAGGARAAVTHLIEHGHRRIAFLGDRPELHTATERLRGYRDALARHGIREEALARSAPPTTAPTRSRASCCSPRTRRPRSSRARTSSPSTPCAPSTTCGMQRDGRARRLRRRGAGRRRRARAHRDRPGPDGPRAHAPPSCSSRAWTATRARRDASCTRRR